MTGHFEALEASFEATYRIDLRRALWGKAKIGVRRLATLIGGLPPGSPLHRSLDPDGWAWGPREELSAQTVEQLDGIARLFWRANFKGNPPGKSLEVPRPKRPVDRAAEKMPRRRLGSTQDLKAALAAEGRLLGQGDADSKGGKRVG